MAVEVKRKPNESMESFMRRFTKRMMESRVLINSKKRRFFESPKSATQQRASATRRKQLQTEREYLRKIGKLTLEMQRGFSPRFSPGNRPSSRPVSRISVRAK
ncbi:MAG TPA: 30S ribosomal protein S21 [Patescibacteria group bacterium]|nr:30S ribosomal protein S21 [Patescibacteria group bacterium]